MNIVQMRKHNIQLVEKDWLKWSEPSRLLSLDNKIQIVDSKHKWHDMYGYLVGHNPDFEISVYLPILAHSGCLGVLDMKQIKRL